MLAAIQSYVDAKFDRFVEELLAFLRIPSISTDPAFAHSVQAAAASLESQFNRMNASDIKVIETPGHPVVIGRWIQDPKFAWAGIYRPEYPEPWASEQTNLATELSSHTYLGWNGTWRLTFGVPVFTWIHQVQNLGWIYG